MQALHLMTVSCSPHKFTLSLCWHYRSQQVKHPKRKKKKKKKKILDLYYQYRPYMNMTPAENNNFSFHLIYLAGSYAKSLKILVRISQEFEAVIENEASITKRCLPYPVTNILWDITELVLRPRHYEQLMSLTDATSSCASASTFIKV